MKCEKLPKESFQLCYQLCYSLVEIKALNFNIMNLSHQHGETFSVFVTILREASRVIPFRDSVTIKVLCPFEGHVWSVVFK